jgi:ABC-2 type transport system permease protein
MSWSRSQTLMIHNWRLLLADPAPIVITTLMPIVLMAFLQGASQAVLAQQGYRSAGGAELAVPGMAVMFAFFGVAFIGTAFYSEHGWGTWDRLRASPAGTLEIVLGKIMPSAALMCGQLVLMFVVGVVLFGLEINGSLAGLAVMIGVSVALLVAFSMLLTAVLSTQNQMMAVVNLAALTLTGLGGALAPVDVLPDWARAVAPLSPAYWMLDGFRAVVLEPGTLGSVLVPATMTMLFAGGLALIAVVRFRVTDEKVWEG